MNSGPLEGKSFELALKIVSICKKLRLENDFVISHQLLKSGTSIGANISEAQGCQSKKDFRAKMSIAYKEAKESNYWLRILKYSDEYDVPMLKEVEELLNEILRMLNATLRTTKP